ncbi:MAG: hypothetical protein ACFB9M_12790 [Myxococcota bacterium]
MSLETTMNALNIVLNFILGLFAIIFLLIGLGWLVAPSLVGRQLGMPLLDGVGLSTQIGDLASLFLTLALCILLALKSGIRIWFYPAIMLLSLTAVGRVLAWALHGAALALDLIGIEVVVASLLFFASRREAPNEV